MKNKLAKDLDHYLGLPYTIVLRRDDEDDVIARIRELPGCVAHGSTEVQALHNVRDMQRLWLEDCLESLQPVPEPEVEERLPSGKWLQRVPRTLHKRLVQVAKRETVSLNQLVTTMLTEAVISRTWMRDRTEPKDCKSCPLNRSEIWDHAFEGNPTWRFQTDSARPMRRTLDKVRKLFSQQRPINGDEKEETAECPQHN